MLYINSMGYFVPENVIDNKFLEDLDIGTSDEWIMERVGISRRRTVLDLDYIKETKNKRPLQSVEGSIYSNRQTGAKAAKMALERAGLKPSDIGMVIAGSSTPQYSTPAEACMIAAELGIQAPAFDLNSACPTFVFQLNFINSMKAEDLPDHILVVNPENVTRCVDYNDRRSAVLFGDATTAAIVSKKVPSRYHVKESMIFSDPSGWEKIVVPAMQHFVQDGSKVQMFAIRMTLSLLKKIKEKMKGDPKDLNFIGHQANLLMLQNVAQKAEIADGKHFYNVDEYGNCGAAGAPCVLAQNWDKFSHGDEIALCIVGAGLSWGGLLISVEGDM